MTNLKEVEKVCEKFNNDVDQIVKEIKRIQSIKCRLKKQKGKSTYQSEMTETLRLEQILKEAKQLLDPQEKPVTRYTQEDVNELDFDETIKAIRSIQSKKTLSRWLTDVECDNDEFRNAVRIEKMLLEHKEQIKPVDDLNVRKSDIQTIIDTIEESGQVSQERIIEMLKGLL
jgi:hypothetical protein